MVLILFVSSQTIAMHYLKSWEKVLLNTMVNAGAELSVLIRVDDNAANFIIILICFHKFIKSNEKSILSCTVQNLK